MHTGKINKHTDVEESTLPQKHSKKRAEKAGRKLLNKQFEIQHFRDKGQQSFLKLL